METENDPNIAYERVFCLNRTMKYGNSFQPHMSLLPRHMFKSYYVVWKPEQYIQVSKRKFLFKSYYVVWKLSQGMQQAEATLKFKSYYVVWKLIYNI